MAYSVLGKTQLMISLALKRPSMFESSSWSNFSFSAINQALSFDCPETIFKGKTVFNPQESKQILSAYKGKEHLQRV